ncbi:gamma-tubulin complex component protein [Phycomyces nitens]|nr:gamma-tubulin complex component protein [Phycomyces nitens]
MLHELLFVLSGYPGDVFIPYPSQNPSTFAIPPEFPLLHPTERESLNRLAQLGFLFAQLTQFVASVKDLKQPKIRQKPCGAYLQAVVTTLEGILNNYRQEIIVMEQRILNKDDEAGDNVVPIALLTSNLGRWELLLPALWKFVLILKDDPVRYHGCCLFDLLMDQARTGMTELREAMEKMIMRLHDVLYRQLTAWMVYGQWVDPDEEFFITRAPQITNEDDDLGAHATGWQRDYSLAVDRIPAHLSQSLAESILFVGKAIATVNSMGSGQLDQRSTSSMLINKRQKIPIPEEMKKRHIQLLLSLHSSSTNKKPHFSPWIVFPQQLQRVVQQIRRSTAEWLFSQVLVGEHGLQRYLESFRQIFLLGYGDLGMNLVDECTLWRQRSISSFSTSVSRPQPFAKHARDEDEERPVEPKPLSKTAIIFRHQELNALLAKATVGTEAEDNLKGYSLEWVEKTKDGRNTSYQFADLLLVNGRCVLVYEMEWPIDLFLSQTDLAHYSELWSFLMGLKNVQMTLGGLWKTLRSGKVEKDKKPLLLSEDATDVEGEYRERVVWRLRFSMLFWVDTLWNHVQVDKRIKLARFDTNHDPKSNVINARYQRLVTTIAPSFQPKDEKEAPDQAVFGQPTALDFEEIQTAHEEYLRDIMRGSLLLSKSCADTMHAILKLCLDFCELVERISDDGVWQTTKRRRTTKTAAEIVDEWTRNSGKPMPRYAWMDQIDAIETNFSSLTKRFFGIVSNQQQDIKTSGHLDLLLMQLDYGKYYSSSGS